MDKNVEKKLPLHVREELESHRHDLSIAAAAAEKLFWNFRRKRRLLQEKARAALRLKDPDLSSTEIANRVTSALNLRLHYTKGELGLDWTVSYRPDYTFMPSRSPFEPFAYSMRSLLKHAGRWERDLVKKTERLCRRKRWLHATINQVIASLGETTDLDYDPDTAA